MFTGIKVNALLFLKVSQLKTLRAEGYIKINHSQLQPKIQGHYTNAYLSQQGKQILKSREKDFNLLYRLVKNHLIKIINKIETNRLYEERFYV